MSAAVLRLWLALSLCLLTSACGDDGAAAGVPSEGEVISLCETLSKELESKATPEQQKAFAQAKAYVEGFDYGKQDGAGGGGGKADGDSDGETQRPTDEAQLYHQVSLLASLSGRHEGALWASLQALQGSPSELAYLLQVAALLTAQKDCDKAELLLRRARQLAPDDGHVRLARAKALLCQGDTKGAADEADEAAKLEKGNPAVEQSISNLWTENQTNIKALEDKLHARCLAEIDQAAKVGTVEAYQSYSLGKLGEVAALSMALLTAPQPVDAPPQFILDIIDSHDRYDLEHDKIDKVRSDIVDKLIAHANKTHKELYDQTVDCQKPSPVAKCSCYRNLCVQGWKLVSNDLSDSSAVAARTYLVKAIPLLKQFKNHAFGVIGRYGSDLSDLNRQWAYDYVYKVGELSCMTFAVSYASTAQVPIAHQKLVDYDCNNAKLICDAQQQAEIEAARKAEEQSFKESQARAAQEAADAQKGTSFKPKGKICFVVGCIGVDGSKISLTVGAGEFLYTKFSYDTKTYTAGVRVGAKISVTKLAGGNISIGGEASPNGTKINVIATGEIKGVGKQQVVLYEARNDFKKK